MAKLWRYIHYDPITHIYTLGEPIKTPEIIDDVSPGVDYVEITDPLQLVEAQAKEYDFYRIEGQNFFNWFRSLYLIKVTAGEVTLADSQIIYDLADPAMQEVDTGSWHKCFELLDALTVDSILTQERKDELVDRARDFINSNYPAPFHV